VGDAYTFICLERATKLVMAWHLGKRGHVNTEDFVSKIRRATARHRLDVSTGGFQPYETAIDAGLYDRANHAAVVKMFSAVTQVVPESYRPAKFVGWERMLSVAILIWIGLERCTLSARMERLASGAKG